MAKQVSMTLPDKVYAALVAKAEYYEMEPAEFLKQFLMASYMGAKVALGLDVVAKREGEALTLRVEQPLALGLSEE